MNIFKCSKYEKNTGFINLWPKACVILFFAAYPIIYSQNGSFPPPPPTDSSLTIHAQVEYWIKQYKVEKDSGHYDAAILCLELAYTHLKRLHMGESMAEGPVLEPQHIDRFSAVPVKKTPGALSVLITLAIFLMLILIWQCLALRSDFRRFRKLELETRQEKPLEAGIADAEPVQEHKTEEQLWLDRVLNVAREKLGDPVFSLESWSEAAGISPRQFQRKLKAATGQTVSAYLQELRLQFARDLLDKDQDQTPKHLAAAVGMRDVKYFSKEFKKRFGLTPSQYRLAKHGK